MGAVLRLPTLLGLDGDQFADQGSELAYDRRTKVEILAASTATLGSVIDDAAEQFGVRSRSLATVAQQVACVAFFCDGDESGMEDRADRWWHAVRTVDAGGLPSWTVAWSEAQLEELVASHAAGLLVGDPLRPYFWPVISQGEVRELGAALWTMWQLWEHALALRETVGWGRKLGARGLRRTLIDRVRHGQTAAREAGPAWSAAVRRPQDLVPYLDQATPTTAEVGELTGLNEEHAEGVLWGMGYVLGKDGRWRPGADAASAALRVGLLEIKRTGRAMDLNEAADRVRAAVDSANASAGDAPR